MEKKLARVLKQQALLADSTMRLQPHSQLPEKAVNRVELFPFCWDEIRSCTLTFPPSFFSLSACKDCISFIPAKSSTGTSKATTSLWAWMDLSSWVGIPAGLQHFQHVPCACILVSATWAGAWLGQCVKGEGVFDVADALFAWLQPCGRRAQLLFQLHSAWPGRAWSGQWFWPLCQW